MRIFMLVMIVCAKNFAISFAKDLIFLNYHLI